MFFQFSPVGKSLFAKKAFSLFFALCLAAGTLVFTGCKDDPGTSGALIGTWISSYEETWTITASTVTADTYTGTIENEPDFEAAEGVIIIKYTSKPEYMDYTSDPPAGPFDPPGEYYAIYWKGLTATSVELANAWDVSDLSHAGAPETANLAEAKTRFTLENASLYAGMYSACEKH
jgi:hypothetical protein